MTPTLRPLPLPFPRVAFAAALILLALAGCQAAEEFASEGTEGAPIDIGIATTTYGDGQVGPQPESSYYTVGVDPDISHTVALSNLENDVILVVYQDSFGGSQLCTAVNPGAAAISCSGMTGSATSSLKIRVLSYSDDGSPYLLVVSASAP
jgi:hypothetical protein